MRQPIGRARALANAGLVLAILALAGFGVTRVADRQWRWQETFQARAEFASIAGVAEGDRVRVQGMDAGVVEAIRPPQEPGGPVTLVLRLDARLRPLVRSDALARIVNQGVVGAKVIEIVPGRPDAPALSESGVLRTEPPVELADLVRDASESLQRIDALARAAQDGLEDITAIASAIRRGEGSLGRLIHDDEAYRKLVALSDRGEKTLNELDENLAALKRTWPLSRYFNDRAYFDRERVLFQPGAERDGRSLSADELFEPGRAVLTAQGRRRLDELAGWIKATLGPRSEIVVAAFTDASFDDDLAQILTQEQAEAVRKYLMDRHKVHSINWFRSRKVAAVGFGTQPPRLLAQDQNLHPARRVEIVLFTPQT